VDNFPDDATAPRGIKAILHGRLLTLPTRIRLAYVRYSSGAGSATDILGGFHPQTQSLWLTDMAHHHLAIAVIFIIAGHQYRTNFGIGHSIKEMLNAKTSWH